MVQPINATVDPYESVLPVLCPNCLAPNGDHQHFCTVCATPLTTLAEIDPLGRTFAFGDTCRKAMANPRRPIVLVGMWVLFVPYLLSGLFWLALFLKQPSVVLDPRDGFIALLFVGYYLAIAVVAGVIVYRTTRNFYRLEPIVELPDDESPDGDVPNSPDVPPDGSSNQPTAQEIEPHH